MPPTTSDGYMVDAYTLKAGDELRWQGTWHRIAKVAAASHNQMHVICDDDTSYVVEPSMRIRIREEANHVSQ